MTREQAQEELAALDDNGSYGMYYQVSKLLDKVYDSFESEINKLEELLQIQKDSLTDDYMIGLYNGIELSITVLREEEPNYIDCPKKTCESCKHGTKIYEGSYCSIVGNTPEGFGCNMFKEK